MQTVNQETSLVMHSQLTRLLYKLEYVCSLHTQIHLNFENKCIREEIFLSLSKYFVTQKIEISIRHLHSIDGSR